MEEERRPWMREPETWEERFLPYPSTLRYKCHQLLRQAMEQKDIHRVRRLSFIEGYLRRSDCLLHKNWCIQRPSDFLPDLGYDRQYVIEQERKIEEKYEFRGKLQYYDYKGQLHTQEAILDPEVEEYYTDACSGIYKIRYGASFYFLKEDGQWVFTPEAGREYYDICTKFYSVKIIRD